MRVLVYPAEKGRCGQRLIWPAEVLQREGADVAIVRSRDDLVFDEWADVVVIQRPMLRRFVEGTSPTQPIGMIHLMQQRGIVVVVDIDDDFTSLNPKNSVFGRVHPSTSPDVNWHHLTTACRQANLVTVTTPALASTYGGHGRVMIIPNHIPQSYLSIPRPNNPVPLVGWPGAVKTHPNDLQVTRGGVFRALQATGARFGLVGPPEHVQEHLWLTEPPLLVQEMLGLPTQIDGDGTPAPGWVDIADYGTATAAIDVGIVPLEKSAFNEAKSNLKGLELAALGVPFVASPTGPYRELAVHAGVLAGKPREWEREVRRLIESPGLRAELAGRGREWAAGQTVEQNAGLWWEAWERARVLAARRRKVTA